MRTCALLAASCAALLSCNSRTPRTPEETVAALADAIARSDGAALWRLVPDEIKEQAAQRLVRARALADAPVLLAVDALATEAGAILSDHRHRVAELPTLRQKLPQEADRAVFADGLALLATALGSGRAEHPERAVERAGPAALQMLVPLLRANGSALLDPWTRPGGTFTRVSDGRVLYQAGSSTDALVRVGDRWLPERWRNGWQELAARIDAVLAPGRASALASHGFQILRLTNQTRGRLRNLAAASDQPSFDDAFALAAGTFAFAVTWSTTRAEDAVAARAGASATKR